MYRGYPVTVEARPSGELRLRRPLPATAIAAVGTQQPAAEPQLRRPGTQIARPDRFHVEVSDPTEMHEFLERLYGRSPPAGDSCTPVALQSSTGKPTATARTPRCAA